VGRADRGVDELELSGAVLRTSKEMDYLDALRENGWLPDPTDTVVVGVEHAGGCVALLGGDCCCAPRLVLREPPGGELSGGGRGLDAAVAWLGAVQAS
jgi:hypothetical protein